MKTNKIKALEHLCKCYKTNMNEIRLLKGTIHSQENIVYFIKMVKMAEAIRYVDDELSKIKDLCGERAYQYYVYRYIDKLSIDETVTKLSTSNSALYREKKKWEEIYEQN